MKKIFAIALALVMVLSMATAFASPCTSGFVWAEDPAATNCGKGSIEVVPYVKVNNSCGGYDWQVSTCAGAVNTENVYYAVKLTVEANADADWWKKASAKLTFKGFDITVDELALAKIWADVKADIKAEDTADEVNTFYYDFKHTEWDIVNDSFTLGNDHVDNLPVKKAADAKVCAELTSKLGSFTEGVVGDYYVKVLADGDEGVMLIVDADDAAKVEDPVVGLVAGIEAAKAAAAVKGETFKLTLSVLADAMPVDNAVGYIFANGEVAVVGKLNDKCSTSFYNAVTSFFGIELGTKMTEKLINKNFGWEDKVKSCFSWSDKAASIVDAECVVAIPKTGDASVLAWLF